MKYLVLFLLFTSCASNEQIKLLQEQNKLLLQLVEGKKDEDKPENKIENKELPKDDIQMILAPKRFNKLASQDYKTIKVRTDKLGNLTYSYNSHGFYKISADEINMNWSVKTEIMTPNNSKPPEFIYFRNDNNLFYGYGDQVSGIRIVKLVLKEGQNNPIIITLKVSF